MSSEMFGNYSAVLQGKSSAIKYCHDMRRHEKRLSFSAGLFHVCTLCQIIVCGPKEQ